jgi:hypothetical protein
MNKPEGNTPSMARQILCNLHIVMQNSKNKRRLHDMNPHKLDLKNLAHGVLFYTSVILLSAIS